MDPTDLLTSLDATDVTDPTQGVVAAGSGSNPSMGLDPNAVLSTLLGDATTAYIANQGAAASIAAAQATPAASSPVLQIEAATGLSGSTLLLIGLGLIVLLIIKR